MPESNVGKESSSSSSQKKRKLAETLGYVQEALRALRFGEITLIVHDGVVVQIERTEKLRLNSSKLVAVLTSTSQIPSLLNSACMETAFTTNQLNFSVCMDDTV
jgi:hypothetical protein